MTYTELREALKEYREQGIELQVMLTASKVELQAELDRIQEEEFELVGTHTYKRTEINIYKSIMGYTFEVENEGEIDQLPRAEYDLALKSAENFVDKYSDLA